MRISDHFRKQEFEKSQTAIRLGISNIVTEPELVANMVALGSQCFGAIEGQVGACFTEFRVPTPDLSQALGSKPTSNHCFAEAVNCEMFKSPGNRPVFEWFVNESGLSWDQIILEHEGEDPFDGWLHISSKRCLSENRKEVLRAVRQDGKTVYLPGIN